jgi:hypothetical protein
VRVRKRGEGKAGKGEGKNGKGPRSERAISSPGTRVQGSTYLRVPNDVEEGDDVWAACEVHEDLDLSLDLLLLHRLEHLDDALFGRRQRDPLEHLRIFSSSNLAHDLVWGMKSEHKGEEGRARS